MSRPKLQQPLTSAKAEVTEAVAVKATAKPKTSPAAAAALAAVPKIRQVHKEGEVNISAYFPTEIKASLRTVQAKTGNNVKECLAEALRDLFKKHNGPMSVELGEGR